MKYQTLLVEIKHSIGIVWMNRPKLHNVFDETMISELIEAMRTLNDDPAIRAVVLAGAGSSFCAGVDLKWMQRMAGCPFEQNHADAINFATLLSTIDTMQKPTIARVHGPAFAGGVGLVAACDIAVAAYEAEFCLSEVRLGLIPSTIGPYVVRAMGERAARRYFLSAELFTAAEAYRIGLVSDITPPGELDTRINELLGQLIQGGPVAQALSKEWIRTVAGVPITPDLIKESATLLATARASEEGREGIGAFIAKRIPAWLGKKKKPAANKSAPPKAKRKKK
ncbi:MAG: enoyl-CoA hydratase/isomerase family protein [Deltaproteobacteria bacterium]|nr:MAG: enoyl-CoA hydratase/isomerase family protein [Deltaproteobacteria bacterium]